MSTEGVKTSFFLNKLNCTFNSIERFISDTTMKFRKIIKLTIILSRFSIYSLLALELEERKKISPNFAFTIENVGNTTKLHLNYYFKIVLGKLHAFLLFVVTYKVHNYILSQSWNFHFSVHCLCSIT